MSQPILRTQTRLSDEENAKLKHNTISDDIHLLKENLDNHFNDNSDKKAKNITTDAFYLPKDTCSDLALITSADGKSTVPVNNISTRDEQSNNSMRNVLGESNSLIKKKNSGNILNHNPTVIEKSPIKLLSPMNMIRLGSEEDEGKQIDFNKSADTTSLSHQQTNSKQCEPVTNREHAPDRNKLKRNSPKVVFSPKVNIARIKRLGKKSYTRTFGPSSCADNSNIDFPAEYNIIDHVSPDKIHKSSEKNPLSLSGEKPIQVINKLTRSNEKLNRLKQGKSRIPVSTRLRSTPTRIRKEYENEILAKVPIVTILATPERKNKEGNNVDDLSLTAKVQPPTYGEDSLTQRALEQFEIDLMSKVPSVAILPTPAPKRAKTKLDSSSKNSKSMNNIRNSNVDLARVAEAEIVTSDDSFEEDLEPVVNNSKELSLNSNDTFIDEIAPSSQDLSDAIDIELGPSQPLVNAIEPAHDERLQIEAPTVTEQSLSQSLCQSDGNVSESHSELVTDIISTPTTVSSGMLPIEFPCKSPEVQTLKLPTPKLTSLENTVNSTQMTFLTSGNETPVNVTHTDPSAMMMELLQTPRKSINTKCITMDKEVEQQMPSTQVASQSPMKDITAVQQLSFSPNQTDSDRKSRKSSLGGKKFVDAFANMPKKATTKKLRKHSIKLQKTPSRRKSISKSLKTHVDESPVETDSAFESAENVVFQSVHINCGIEIKSPTKLYSVKKAVMSRAECIAEKASAVNKAAIIDKSERAHAALPDLRKMRIAQLKALAAERDIYIDGAHLKSDIMKRIEVCVAGISSTAAQRQKKSVKNDVAVHLTEMSAIEGKRTRRNTDENKSLPEGKTAKMAMRTKKENSTFDLKSLTIVELRDYAAKRNIDVKRCKLKAHFIDVIAACTTKSGKETRKVHGRIEKVKRIARKTGK